MFYSEALLSKRGPLARVWLAAHWERKLSKAQFLQTDIANSVGAIVETRGAPMALRLSGQLLLGVVRIYSRKARYLLEDCNEALLKIKMAFRSGANVDLAPNQATVNKQAITMRPTRTDYDLLLPDPFLQTWDAELTALERAPLPPAPAPSDAPSGSGARPAAHTARESDITLPRNTYGLYDDDYAAAAADLYAEGGIGSQDWDESGQSLDLGLDLGLDLDEPMPDAGDDHLSVGLGREPGPGHDRDLVSVAGSERPSERLSVGLDFPTAGPGAADDLPPLDFGGFEDMPPLDDMPPLEDMPEPGPGSRVRTPVPVPEGGDDDTLELLGNVSPGTLARIRDAASRRAAQIQRPARAEGRPLVDRVLETQQGRAAVQRPDDIVQEGDLLPADPAEMEVRTIANDPIGYYVPELAPAAIKEAGSFYAGPESLAPNLRSLFTFTYDQVRRKQIALDEALPEPSPKRARLTPGADMTGLTDLGLGRDAAAPRASLGPFPDQPLPAGPGAADDLLPLDDMPALDDMPDLPPLEGKQPEDLGADLTLPEEEEEMTLRRSTRTRAARGGEPHLVDLPELPPLSRMSTPEADEGLGFLPTASDPLRGFQGGYDPTAAAAVASAQAMPAVGDDSTTAGWSRNTVRALGVLRDQLVPGGPAQRAEREEAAADAGEEPSTNTKMSFQRVSGNATRRAAAAFFFELLVLGTKDAVRLEQPDAYGDIRVEAKDKLWDVDVVQPGLDAPVPASAQSQLPSQAPSQDPQTPRTPRTRTAPSAATPMAAASA